MPETLYLCYEAFYEDYSPKFLLRSKAAAEAWVKKDPNVKNKMGYWRGCDPIRLLSRAPAEPKPKPKKRRRRK